ncbi:YtxH domain-containing protein [Capnocytophaga cynodegmi]|uniref:YtxH domain-containing protein n=1 Tax=Capnocytophaga cynodegmi TaxID=28189 RepID=UPI00385B5708
MAKTGNVLLALVTGVAIGAGAGILFAPNRGEDTRQKIKDSVDEKTSKLKKKMDKLAREVKGKSSEIKGTLEDNIESLLAKSEYKTEEVINLLDKKLNDLKKNVKS